MFAVKEFGPPKSRSPFADLRKPTSKIPDQAILLKVVIK